MPLELTTKATLLKDQTNVKQQIILEIDGIPFIYGAVEVTKLALYGDNIVYGQDGLVYGGVIADEDGRSYLSLEGTTRKITQQLEIDKGGVGSVQKFNVTLVDKNQEVTKAFTPDAYVPDILSREANVYIAFQGGAHPEDSVRIFNGIVTGQKAKPGNWNISIDHPEFLKRQDLFTQISTNLTSGISDTATTIPVVSTQGIVPPQDAVSSYVRIKDEIIGFTGITATSLTGATRGEFDTIADSHSLDDDAQTFYRLQGDPIDLALKIMLSDSGNNPFKSDVEASRFVQVDPTQQITNGIYFQDNNLVDNLGLELGDLISISGDVNPANNITDATIAAIVSIPTGTVLVVSGATLVISVDSPAVASFKSQYNTLPTGAGCAMKPSQVDVKQHLLMKTLFPSLPEYDFYIKDTINAKEFITNEVYFPSGFYQVPRKGRSSVNTTIPPLVLDQLVELTDQNTKKAESNSIERQISKNFFNSVVYRFNEDAVEDKFKSGVVQVSNRSKNRIDTGNKSLTITSKGFRGDANTVNFINSQSRRYADRWQFAAESIKVSTDYKTGFGIEIADVVLFGNESLQIPDINEGSRSFKPRLMEVVNKSLDIRGDVSFELLDSGFGLDGRFGVISPNSFIGSGSTVSSIVLKPSYGTGEFEVERLKYENFIGQEIRVRSIDFTYEEVTKLIQFDPSSLNRILVDPPLSSAPPEDYIIDLPEYPDNTDADDRRKMKTIHVFFDPQVTITSGISTTEFEVGAADIDKFLVGAFVIIHNDSYSDASTPDSNTDDLTVISVDTGTNRITVGDMGFTPSPGDKVDLIGFKDGGLPYRMI